MITLSPGPWGYPSTQENTVPAPPYGYKYRGGKLVQDGDEQKVLRLMQRLRVREGLSFGKIAGELNQQKLKNRGKYWHANTVRYLLQNAGTEGKPRRKGRR